MGYEMNRYRPVRGQNFPFLVNAKMITYSSKVVIQSLNTYLHMYVGSKISPHLEADMRNGWGTNGYMKATTYAC